MIDKLVSIIIPAYNAAKHIRETVLSALGQTWGNIEVIVVNNGSTDNTAGILSKLNGIKVINTDPGSAAAARNVGITMAKGRYVQFLDADDLLSPDKIAAQMAILNDADDMLAICSTVQFKSGDDATSAGPDKNWYHHDHADTANFLIKLYAGNEQLPGYGGFVAVHSWLTPRAIIDIAGPWDEQLSTDDDGEFFCRVVLAANGIRYSVNGRAYYRRYDNINSLSAQKTLKSFHSAVLAIDLKYKWLKAASADPIIDKIFARHYWWTGVVAYPQYKLLAKKCTTLAKKLGYQGPKYVGGRSGHIISKLLGWKLARIFSYYKHK